MIIFLGELNYTHNLSRTSQRTLSKRGIQKVNGRDDCCTRAMNKIFNTHTWSQTHDRTYEQQHTHTRARKQFCLFLICARVHRRKKNTLHVYLICRPGLGPAHNKHNKTQIQITMTQIQISSRQYNRWHRKKNQITRQKKYTRSGINTRVQLAHTQEYNWHMRKSTKEKVTAQTTHKRTHRSTHSNHSNFSFFKNSDQSKCSTPG